MTSAGAALAPGHAAAAWDRVVRAQLWLAAGLVEIALRHRRVPDLVAAAGRAAGSPATRWYPAGRRALSGTRLDELAADAGAFWRGDSACLSRSLLRGWLAATAGRSVSLVVGVRREPGTPFGAHAWLEVDGGVHAEEQDPTLAYHPIATYPLADQRRAST
jgi:hypothetical protein